MERSYRCLACDDSPVFDGKLRAHVHVSRVHADLLSSHHVDELLEELPDRQLTIFDALPSDTDVPPFHCIHCRLAGRPTTRGMWSSMKDHLDVQHKVYNPLNGADYEDEGTLIRRKQDEDAKVDRFAETVHGLRGVADFLTECDA